MLVRSSRIAHACVHAQTAMLPQFRRRARPLSLSASARAQPALAAPAQDASAASPHEAVSRILAEVEEAAVARASAARVRTIAVLCDNESGLLSRVAGTLSARGFNIDSLTVSPTNLRTLSRMTIVMSGVTEQKASQALKQLSDIVSVWAVVDYTESNHITRELAMVKVAYLPPPLAAAPASIGYRALVDAQPHRTAVRDIGALFGAEVVDVGAWRLRASAAPATFGGARRRRHASAAPRP